MKIKHLSIEVPQNMQSLTLTDNGYLKPWFVKDNDFRVVDGKKARMAIEKKACWICGKPFDIALYALVASPVSAIVLMTREPPCHIECAEYAMQVCPFILYPKSKRRVAGLSEKETLEHLNKNLDVKYDAENPGEYYLLLVDDFYFESDSKSIRCLESNVQERQYWVGGQKQSSHPKPILEFSQLPQDLQIQLVNRTSWPFSDVVPRPPELQSK